MPLRRARSLAGDLYQAASLNLWAQAISGAQEPEKAELIALQDSVCDAADLFRTARTDNPRHLRLYWIACLDRKGLPATTPVFVTAASEAEALRLWDNAFKGKYGRCKPHAFLAPELADAATLHR